jgi:hypothetical protein
MATKPKPKLTSEWAKTTLEKNEVFIYVLLTTILIINYLKEQTDKGIGLLDAARSFDADAVLSCLPVILVVLFLLVFGRPPLAFVRERIIATRAAPVATVTGTESYLDLQALLINRSRTLADGLFSRAGIYLFIGGAVAVGAALAFYAKTSGVTMPKDATLTMILAEFAPRLSFLFFLELIAFFFLRQYRVAMDDFRYYEEIQRKREESMIAVNLIVEHCDKSMLSEFIRSGTLSSNVQVLKENETTSTLETRKLEKSELDLFKTIVETVGGKKTA